MFLMACQWQVVRTALESAGFSCVALSNVCQWLSEAEVESTEATASSSLPPFLSQSTTVTPAPDMLTLGASLGCPQSPKIKYEDLGKKFPKLNRDPLHRCSFRNTVET